MYHILIIYFLFSFVNVFSQELNATVSVNFQQVANGNPQLFKNLETQVKEFLNTTKWTTKEFTDVEKIDCNFFINVTSYGSNTFEATLQVQSSRPIYNSNFSSPILNINDKNFTFMFSFESPKLRTVIYRSYIKIQNLLASIGGCVNAIILILRFSTSHYLRFNYLYYISVCIII